MCERLTADQRRAFLLAPITFHTYGSSGRWGGHRIGSIFGERGQRRGMSGYDEGSSGGGENAIGYLEGDE